MKLQKKKTVYKVIDKFVRCVTTDSDGRYILATANQTTLKKLYENGSKEIIKEG